MPSTLIHLVGPTPATVDLASLQAAAAKVARASLRRTGWSMASDADHYTNHACMAMLECAGRGGYDATRCSNPLSYLARAGFLAVKRAITKDRALVTGSESLVRTVVTTRLGDTPLHSSVEDRHGGPNTAWCSRVRSELHREFADVETTYRKAGIEVLLGASAIDTGERYSISVRALYRTTARMRKRIAASRRLAELAEDIT